MLEKNRRVHGFIEREREIMGPNGLGASIAPPQSRAYKSNIPNLLNVSS